MERKPTLVVALGGNALLKRGEPLEAEIQRQNIELAARTIAGLTVNWRVVLVHGNGPQIGLLALQNSAYDKVTPYPLDVLGAESQGMIGYMLQQALKNSLPQRGSRDFPSKNDKVLWRPRRPWPPEGYYFSLTGKYPSIERISSSRSGNFSLNSKW